MCIKGEMTGLCQQSTFVVFVCSFVCVVLVVAMSLMIEFHQFVLYDMDEILRNKISRHAIVSCLPSGSPERNAFVGELVFRSILNGRLRCLRMLLETEGLDVNGYVTARGVSWTPLQLAIRHQSWVSLLCLLELGADPLKCDEAGGDGREVPALVHAMRRRVVPNSDPPRFYILWDSGVLRMLDHVSGQPGFDVDRVVRFEAREGALGCTTDTLLGISVRLAAERVSLELLRLGADPNASEKHGSADCAGEAPVTERIEKAEHGSADCAGEAPVTVVSELCRAVDNVNRWDINEDYVRDRVRVVAALLEAGAKYAGPTFDAMRYTRECFDASGRNEKKAVMVRNAVRRAMRLRGALLVVKGGLGKGGCMLEFVGMDVFRLIVRWVYPGHDAAFGEFA